jgi:hypothetical protein
MWDVLSWYWRIVCNRAATGTKHFGEPPAVTTAPSRAEKSLQSHNGPKRRKAGQNLNVFMIFCENMYIGVFEVADYESKFKF